MAAVELPPDRVDAHREGRPIPVLGRLVALASVRAAGMPEDREIGPGLPVKAILQQATYMQPALPAVQLAAAITAGLGGDAQAIPAALLVPAVPIGQGHLAARVMQVALEPAELGVITVRMQLAGDTLRLHVSAERGGTASLLERDRDQLAKVLHSAGYDIENVTIRIDADRSAAGGPQSTSPQVSGQQAQSDPQTASHGRSGDEERSRGRSQSETHEPVERGYDDTEGSRLRASGGLYV